MEIISYCYNLDDRILVNLGQREELPSHLMDTKHWLQVSEGILDAQLNPLSNQLLFKFDKEKIDANSLLHLLGYSGPFIRSRVGMALLPAAE